MVMYRFAQSFILVGVVQQNKAKNELAQHLAE